MLSATILVTSAYPLLQVFPHLAITLLGCIAIAVFRLYRAKQKATSISSKEMVNRRTMAESNRRNTQTTSRARQTTERLSVAELVERSKNNKRTPRPQSRPGVDSKTTSLETPSSGVSGRTTLPPASSPRASSRRGTASEVRRVRSTDASRRTARRDVSSRDGSSREYRHGDIAGRSGYASRTGRRVTEAQRNQERARRAQSDTRHATDGAVNAAGSDRTSRARPDARLRPDPRRRAGDVQKTVKRPTPPTDAPSKQAPAPAPDAADNRKRAPRALDEDLYGN